MTRTAALVAGVALVAGCTLPADQAPGARPVTGDQRVVPLQILQGPQNQTLAFVPVEINGQGPYLFALDTGASSSVVDADIAAALGLTTVSRGQPVTGVAAQTEADIVRVENWRLPGVDLPAARIASIDLPSPAGGQGLQGLLGSDMLAGFGRITVDYDREQLLLPAG